MSLSPALHPPSPTICLCPLSPPPRRHPAPSPPRISEIGALHTPGPWGSRPVHGKSMHCGLLEEPDMDSTGKSPPPPQAAGSFRPSGRTFQLDRGSAGGSGGEPLAAPASQANEAGRVRGSGVRGPRRGSSRSRAAGALRFHLHIRWSRGCFFFLFFWFFFFRFIIGCRPAN